jgi:acyl carrier protein
METSNEIYVISQEDPLNYSSPPSLKYAVTSQYKRYLFTSAKEYVEQNNGGKFIIRIFNIQNESNPDISTILKSISTTNINLHDYCIICWCKNSIIIYKILSNSVLYSYFNPYTIQKLVSFHATKLKCLSGAHVNKTKNNKVFSKPLKIDSLRHKYMDIIIKLEDKFNN